MAIRSEDHVLRHADAYLHGALAAADAAAVTSHCEVCPICKVALDEARKRFDLMTSLPHVEASEQLILATEQRVSERRSQSLRKRALLWFVERKKIEQAWLLAGTVAAVLLFAQIFVATRVASPFDLRVLGQTELLADTDASLRVLLSNRDANRAVEGVRITMELSGPATSTPIRLASFTTDAQGTGSPKIHLPDWPDGEYTLRVVAKTSGSPQLITQSVKLQRSWKLMLSTDKPVYQPGQTIHVRSLALRRPDLKPVAGNDIVFRITDPKGNRIFLQRDVTSRFGISSADCPLANEILGGIYQIECEVGGTTSKRSIEVKNYTLPKFKVAVDVDAPYYKPGDTIRGTVQANYFFGKPLVEAGAVVEMQIVDVAPGNAGKANIQTDASGKATFTLQVPDTLVGREQDSGDARILIQVIVTDSAGQVESKSVSRLVTAHPIRIGVIPEAGRLVKDVPNTIYLFATYADGRPARARIAISGRDQEVSTDALGVAAVELTPFDPIVNWVIRATDEAGLSGRREIRLRCGDAPHDFLVRPDKAVLSAGETLSLVALGAGQEPIFVDLLKDGQTILADTITMAEGKGAYNLELPPDVFGTIELCAYRYGGDGLPVRKSRAIYVRPADSLRIQTSLDRAEYRPGESAKLNVKIVDENGKSKPGAVSLSAVDEAVFSVLDQAAGLEQTFFNLEDEILKPVYAIYPWSPAASLKGNPEEQRRFEQALFSATAGRKSRDRDSLLRDLVPYIGSDRAVFDVLDRPDWEELVHPGEFPEKTLELLRNSKSEHSLNSTTHIENLRRTEMQRRERQSSMNTMWVALAICCVAVLLIQFRQHRLAEYLFVGIVIAVLIALLLPATQQAREASKRSSDRNALRGIEFAIANFAEQERYGKVPDREDNATAASTPPVRVREWFPETLLWRPELITDDNGLASIDVILADSITTWRMSASAVTASGELGGSESSIRVFQPFFVDLNLPVALTRGDEVSVPVVVYNYLDKPQTVKLSIEKQPWFELLEETDKSVELAAGEVRGLSYRLRVGGVGKHELQVTANSGDLSDAIRREIEVVPDGRRVEQVVNGTLQQAQTIELALPADAIEGSAKTLVKFYPSSFSQLVEGLDGIFQRPYGCFEQTSSTTYPNVLALDYLRRTKKSVPEVEATARQYIHLGYQRLLSFEIDGGGFDWFGRPPANRTLTAYGLMEFEDMARVHDVDRALIDRTRQWLLKQRLSDGSWEPESHQLHDDPTRGGNRSAQLSTTAYIAWAVYASGESPLEAQSTLGYLLSNSPSSIDDPYTLALVCNAILAINPYSGGSAALPYLERLVSMKQSSSDGKQSWWQNSDSARTAFFGAGQSGDIEATALATLALLKAKRDAAVTRGALTWLTAQKDSSGTWHSTQATVLALKALLEGTGAPLGGEQPRRITVAVDGGSPQEIVIPADQAEVMKQIDLSAQVAAGSHRLTLSEQSGEATGFQVAFSYHVPEGKSGESQQQPLAISIVYDRTSLSVNEIVTATADVINKMNETAPMLILDLPIPAGFELRVADVQSWVDGGTVAKFQITPRSAIVYLRALEPGKPLKLTYRLHATMPVKLTVPAAVAYEYYDPAKTATSGTAELTVVAGS